MHTKPMFVGLILLLASISGGAAMASAADTAATNRELLRQRLDLTASHVILVPTLPSGVETYSGPGFDPEAFKQALIGLTGVAGIQDIEATSELWRAESLLHVINVDLWGTRFVVRDLRAYDIDKENMPRDDALTAKAAVLMPSLGVRPDEAGSVALRNLGVAPVQGGTQSVGHHVARLVYVDRTLGSIPIRGDRLLFGFAFDGSLRKLLGHWHRVAYGQSHLISTLTDEQFVETALDALIARGIDPRSDLPIRLATEYVPREVAPGLSALDLKGVAMVSLHGPNGTRKWSRHEFDI